MVIAGTMYIIFFPHLCLQVSLCDDYSLPVDFVNKRRSASAAAATSTVQWTLPSPTVENVSDLTFYKRSKPILLSLFCVSGRYLKFCKRKTIYFTVNFDGLLQTSALSCRNALHNSIMGQWYLYLALSVKNSIKDIRRRQYILQNNAFTRYGVIAVTIKLYSPRPCLYLYSQFNEFCVKQTRYRYTFTRSHCGTFPVRKVYRYFPPATCSESKRSGGLQFFRRKTKSSE